MRDNMIAKDNQTLLRNFNKVRRDSEQLISNLSVEDCQLQAMPDVSPMKWHLAHTTWFFETFLLVPHLTNYCIFNAEFKVLFNSYYNGVGEQFSRAYRGTLSRPSLESVLEYRRYVDQAMAELLTSDNGLEEIVELGINHEQQHQELMLMDIKYNFSFNPLLPAYHQPAVATANKVSTPLEFVQFKESIITVGAALDEHFSYDNERPNHSVLMHPFSLANRLVTNGEYLEFINQQGYQQPIHWLSDGWNYIQKEQLTQPLYWHFINEEWFEFTLNGLQPLDLNAAVTHVNYYEACAYANFVNSRLPTEFEWEYAAQQPDTLLQLSDSGWQWTNSAYLPYPGFKPISGVAGEYNGKFMSNQMVLRGGCQFTPNNHSRSTYRNFYYPHQAWMQSSIRLARDSE